MENLELILTPILAVILALLLFGIYATIKLDFDDERRQRLERAIARRAQLVAENYPTVRWVNRFAQPRYRDTKYPQEIIIKRRN